MKVGLRTMLPQVRSKADGCSASGLRRASVSVNVSPTTPRQAAPKTATANSATRQSNRSDSRPPNGAHRQAMMPSPLKPLDMVRAPSAGVYASRTMARAHITAAPIAAP